MCTLVIYYFKRYDYKRYIKVLLYAGESLKDNEISPETFVRSTYVCILNAVLSAECLFLTRRESLALSTPYSMFVHYFEVEGGIFCHNCNQGITLLTFPVKNNIANCYCGDATHYA